MTIMKGKSKKQMKAEIEARVAAATAAGELKLAEAKEEHARELANARRQAEEMYKIATEFERGFLKMDGLARIARETLDLAYGEVERGTGLAASAKELLDGQIRILGALASSVDAMSFAAKGTLAENLLTAIDGFVKAAQDGAGDLLGIVDEQLRTPSHVVARGDELASEAERALSPEFGEEETVEIYAEPASVAETEAERAFFGE